jgi:beta-galactosidase GanA
MTRRTCAPRARPGIVLLWFGAWKNLMSSSGIESIWEGTYVDGRWVPGRLLNGDESHQGRHLRIPESKFGIQRVRLYRYQ